MDSPVGDLVKNIKVDREGEREREIDKIEKERRRNSLILYENKSKKLVPVIFLPFLYIKLERPT